MDSILLPNLFISFLARPPDINAHYKVTRALSEKWLCDLCAYQQGSTMQLKISACDFTYFCAILAPEADPLRFRTICDWGNWVFPFDDQFDNGKLRDDPVGASALIDSLLTAMSSNSTARSVEGLTEFGSNLVTAHTAIWKRLQASAPSECMLDRYKEYMRDYCTGALCHINDSLAGYIPEPEKMLQTRRSSAGVWPLLALIQFGHGINLTEEILRDPIVMEIGILGVDFVLIQNDMLSYQKEEAEGVLNNLVASCRIRGSTAQEAYDFLASMLKKRFVRFDEVLAQLPSWGPDTDRDVARYIEGVRNVVRANLYWSFHSERYFGSRHKEVSETHIIKVLSKPSYLNHAVC